MDDKTQVTAREIAAMDLVMEEALIFSVAAFLLFPSLIAPVLALCLFWPLLMVFADRFLD